MNIKELAKLLKEKNYNEFCNSVSKLSPRVFGLNYFDKYVEKEYGTEFAQNFQKELYENVSFEQFKKWRHAFSLEAENDYIQKNNLDALGYFYELTPEEKKQACLI